MDILTGDIQGIYDLIVSVFETCGGFSEEHIRKLKSGNKELSFIRSDLSDFLTFVRTTGLVRLSLSQLPF